MNETERAQLLERIHQGSDALHQAITGVSEEQAAFRPVGDRWSIRDCVEHLVLTEDAMYTLITQHRMASDPAAANLQRDAMILRGMPDRSRKFAAPEMARPSGRFRTLREAVERFDRNRNRAEEFTRGCRENLRGFTVNHPVIGAIDSYQCMLMIALHPVRHAQQIQEVRSDAAFPSA